MGSLSSTISYKENQQKNNILGLIGKICFVVQRPDLLEVAVVHSIATFKQSECYKCQQLSECSHHFHFPSVISYFPKSLGPGSGESTMMFFYNIPFPSQSWRHINSVYFISLLETFSICSSWLPPGKNHQTVLWLTHTFANSLLGCVCNSQIHFQLWRQGWSFQRARCRRSFTSLKHFVGSLLTRE